MLLNGQFLDNNADRRKFSGELLLEKKKFDIIGFMDFNDDIVTNIQLELRPRDNSEPIALQYRLQPQPNGYSVRSELRQAQHHARIEGHLTAKHIYHWDLHIRVCLINTGFRLFNINVKFISDGHNTSDL